MDDLKDAMKGMKLLMILMVLSFGVVGLWNKMPLIKNSVHSILDPSLGSFLGWNVLWGVIISSILLSLFFTLVQKFATDQNLLKAMKEEGKRLREEAKAFKDDPIKMLEIQKKQFSNMPKMMEITMKPLMYTLIPMIFLFRWFNDYFLSLGNPKIFIGLGWLGTYFIFSIIGSVILRKMFKVH